MADVAVTKSTAASGAPKKAKKTAAVAKKAASPKVRAHPPTSEMVVAAIQALNDKKGSSLQSIKKYIAGHFVCDMEKQALFIRKFLKAAVEKNTLVRTKGVGAAGSFKLTKSEPAKKPAAKKSEAKEDDAAKKSAPAKKTANSKKTMAKKPAAVAAPKKPKASKPKSPVKKTGKSPTAKPKAPKAKAAAKTVKQ